MTTKALTFPCPHCGAEHPGEGPPPGFSCPACGKPVTSPAERVSRAQTMPAPGADPLVGRIVLDKYRLERRLGGGGFGEVYEATEVALEAAGHTQRVAVKFVKEIMTPEQRAQFLKEAARWRALTGMPGVVQLLEYGSDEGLARYCYAMEFVDGTDLGRRVLEGGTLTAAEAAAVGIAVAETLGVIFDRHGLVHRDIKPQNILLDGEGNPKLCDFGLAKSVTETFRTINPARSWEFTAPEQFQGRDLDHRSDLYSLGATLYYATGGRPPFALESMHDFGRFQQAVVGEEPTDLCALNPRVPREFARIVHALLAKAPESRPAHAREASLALRDFLEAARGAKVSCYFCASAADPKFDFCGRCGAPVAASRDIHDRVAAAHNAHGACNFPEAVARVEEAIAIYVEARAKLSDSKRSGDTGKELVAWRDRWKEERSAFEALLGDVERLEQGGDLEGAAERARGGLERFPDAVPIQERVRAIEVRANFARSKERLLAIQDLQAAFEFDRIVEACAEILRFEDHRDPQFLRLKEEIQKIRREAQDGRRRLEEAEKKARLLERRGDRGGAIAAWEGALRIRLNHETATRRIAELRDLEGKFASLDREVADAMRDGDLEGALAVFSRMAAIAPLDAAREARRSEVARALRGGEAGVEKARAALREGDLAAALAVLEDLPRETAALPEVVRLRRQVERLRGRLDLRVAYAEGDLRERAFDRARARIEGTTRRFPRDERLTRLRERLESSAAAPLAVPSKAPRAEPAKETPPAKPAPRARAAPRAPAVALVGAGVVVLALGAYFLRPKGSPQSPAAVPLSRWTADLAETLGAAAARGGTWGEVAEACRRFEENSASLERAELYERLRGRLPSAEPSDVVVALLDARQAATDSALEGVREALLRLAASGAERELRNRGLAAVAAEAAAAPSRVEGEGERALREIAQLLTGLRAETDPLRALHEGRPSEAGRLQAAFDGEIRTLWVSRFEDSGLSLLAQAARDLTAEEIGGAETREALGWLARLGSDKSAALASPPEGVPPSFRAAAAEELRDSPAEQARRLAERAKENEWAEVSAFLLEGGAGTPGATLEKVRALLKRWEETPQPRDPVAVLFEGVKSRVAAGEGLWKAASADARTLAERAVEEWRDRAHSLSANPPELERLFVESIFPRLEAWERLVGVGPLPSTLSRPPSELLLEDAGAILTRLHE